MHRHDPAASGDEDWTVWVEAAGTHATDGAYDAALDALDHARSLIDPDVPLHDLDQFEADLLHLRCIDADDPAVLDATLVRLEQLCAAADPPAQALLRRGQLHLLRAEGDGALIDLDAAVRWLEAATPVVDDPERGFAWMLLGAARSTRWSSTDDPADRDRAIDCLELALEHGIGDTGLETVTHTNLVDLCVHALAADPSPAVVRSAVRAYGAACAALAGVPLDAVAERAALAMALACLEVRLHDRPEHRQDVERLAAHCAIARSHPGPPDHWAAQLGVLEWHVQTARDVLSGGTGGLGIEHLLAAADAEVRPEAFDRQIGEMLAVSSVFAASRSGELEKARDAAQLSTGETSFEGQWVGAATELMRLHRQGVPAAEMLAVVDRLIAGIEADAAAVVDGRWHAELVLPTLLTMRAALAPTDAPPLELPPRTVSGLAADLMGDLASVTRSFIAAAGPGTDATQQLHELMELERHAQDLPQGLARSAAVHGLAAGWRIRAEHHLEPDAVERAIRWGETALAADEGPEHPMWLQTTRDTAQVYRLRGRPADLERSRALGLDLLRAHAWMALLQSGTEDGLAVARRAAAEAVRIARWCLHDRDSERLVAALDSGRGLVLHAATTTRGVAEQLLAAGQPDLAEAWSRAGGNERITLRNFPELDVHGNLRRRALTALGASRAPVLDPPSSHRIRAALAAHGSAAVVYLVPADGVEPGLAVVVPADEPVEVVELPDLDVGTAADLADRVESAVGRDIDPPRVATTAGRVEDMLDWAWRTAGGELAALADRLRARDCPPPRLLLVPFGALARIPWHAAAPGGRGPGLLDRAVVSTIPSGRMLCQTVARPTWAGSPALIVGNPTGDLRAAGVEARALVGAFYPDAIYLGRDDLTPPSAGHPVGIGDAAQVTARLEAGAEPLSLLHLACHGHADPAAPGRSCVRLADRAVDVDELMALRKAEPLDVGTVCLAACSTNVSGTDYDEAFSLATAFLAAGARTALASMWTVPDDHTSRLMFMVHHYLVTEGCLPSDALHRARLWARDPRRVPPDSMPQSLAADMAGAEDPIAWAGFQHVGA